MTIGRPSSNEILKDQLYLGNLASAQSLEHRQKLQVTHIVSVCQEYLPTGGGPNSHLHIPVDDTEYEDLLIHLPRAYRFIQEALNDGGRVLVHCVMGISRSATVVAGFLMQSRKMDARSAMRYIKQRRPQVHPNYGFIKQLDTYAKCHYEPSPSNAAYRSWKKRQQQDVTNFLNQLVDTVSIIPDKLLLNSDFPEDSRQAESLLSDLGITHVLSITPAEIPSTSLTSVLKSSKHHRHINIRNNLKEDMLLSLPGAVKFIEDAVEEIDGLVLIHSLMEVRACTIACAFLMKQHNIASDEAFSMIEDILPLFNPTVNFSRNLDIYEACGYQPSKDHPVVEEWLSPTDSSESRLKLGKTTSKNGARGSGDDDLRGSIPYVSSSKSYYRTPIPTSTPTPKIEKQQQQQKPRITSESSSSRSTSSTRKSLPFPIPKPPTYPPPSLSSTVPLESTSSSSSQMKQQQQQQRTLSTKQIYRYGYGCGYEARTPSPLRNSSTNPFEESFQVASINSNAVDSSKSKSKSKSDANDSNNKLGMDMEAKALELLSETGFDLNAFGNALKEIGRTSLSATSNGKSEGNGNGRSPTKSSHVGVGSDSGTGFGKMSVSWRQQVEVDTCTKSSKRQQAA